MMLYSSEIVALWRIMEIIHAGEYIKVDGIKSIKFLHDIDQFFIALKKYGFSLGGKVPNNFLEYSHMSSCVLDHEVVIVINTPLWSMEGILTDVFVEIEIRRSTDTIYIIRGHGIM